MKHNPSRSAAFFTPGEMMPIPVWKKRKVNRAPIIISVLIATAAMGFIVLLIDWMFSQ